MNIEKYQQDNVPTLIGLDITIFPVYLGKAPTNQILGS